MKVNTLSGNVGLKCGFLPFPHGTPMLGDELVVIIDADQFSRCPNGYFLPDIPHGHAVESTVALDM